MMSYLPCKKPCFVGKLGNWIQVWLPQITQQCAHVLESRKIRKYRETWTLYVLSVPQTKPAGSFVLHGNVVDFYVSYVIHRLCLCIYIYMVWHIDIVIVVSLHSFLCQYHGQGGISFPDAISSNIPKLSPILTIQKNMDGETATGSQTKAPFPSPNITTPPQVNQVTKLGSSVVSD